MKNIFFLSLILCIQNIGVSQTKVIAHKSHSGNMALFSTVAGPDNIGEMMIDLNEKLTARPLNPLLFIDKSLVDSLIKITDSSLIQISKIPVQDSLIRQIDTIVYYPFETDVKNLPTQDLKSYYPPEVIFIGFDSLKEEEPIIQPIEPVDTVQKSSKKSSLLPQINGGDNTNHFNGAYGTSFLVLILFILMVSMFFIILIRNKTNLFRYN